MNLSRKALIITGTAAFCFIVMLYGASHVIVLKSFEHLQLQHTGDNALRARSVLWGEVLALDTTTHDWAAWNDTYAFIQDRNQDYINATLTDSSFLNARLNIVLYFNTSGQLVYGKAVDFQTKRRTPIPQNLMAHLAPSSPLIRHTSTDSSLKGIIMLSDEGPLLIASRPILTSKNQGPIRGSLIMARYVDSSLIEYVKEKTLLAVSIGPTAEGSLPIDFQKARAALSSRQASFAQPVDEEIFAGYSLFEDVYGNPALIIKVEEEGSIYQEGTRTLLLYVVSLILFGILFAGLTVVLLHRVIIQRLVKLSGTLSTISVDKDFSARLPVSQHDELSTLALTANEMLASLERSHQEVLQREELFRSITTAAQDAIIMIDHQGLLAFWNPAAERIFGFTAAEILGAPHRNLISQADYEAYSHSFQLLLEPGDISQAERSFEVQGVRKDGAVIPLEISFSRLSYHNTMNALGIVRDISERKAAEEQLRRSVEEAQELNRELEKAIARANELAVQAEVATLAKSEFVANMSHEIRTPLNGIIGLTLLLMDTTLAPDQQTYVQRIRLCGDTLLSLVNDVLDFSKIEARRLELETLDFDLRVVLEEILDVLGLRAQEKGLELIGLVDPEVPSELKGDPVRLRQVLSNLATNAIKFTSSGEVSLFVHCIADDDTYSTIRFEVTDTGIGIPSYRKECIFEPFTQVDITHTRKYGGTGLGLSISKQLVELMGGTIGMESEEGRGSTFWFSAVFIKRPPVVHRDTAVLQDVRVLGVDANAASCRQLSVLLGAWGCRFEGAAGVAAALDMLTAAAHSGDPFRIVIIDFHTSEGSGDSLCRRIAEYDILPVPALVLMVPLSEGRLIARPDELGFSGALTKPLKESQLAECLLAIQSGAQYLSAGMRTGLFVEPRMSESRNRRILVAEDDTTNQMVILGILKKLGYQTDVVSNGEDAVETFRNGTYDLILMDCRMPKMDGYTATGKIRSSDLENSMVPIIALTAHSLTGYREECLKAGMNDCLTKPINLQALTEMLDKWLDHGRPACDQVSDEVMDPGENLLCGEAVVFDHADLLDRLMGDEDLARQVAAGFLADFPLKMDAMRQALSQRDASFVANCAHAMKGASANVGAPVLQRIAQQLEQAGKAGDCAQAAELFFRMEEELDRLAEVLTEVKSEK
ncbi:MAG TPA: CHASE4 domain-containing protein [Thermodesulfobacteriota bacterium]|nr:CHASE4 domain-containing protein [Thermodesulfobacteriota bacterium]